MGPNEPDSLARVVDFSDDRRGSMADAVSEQLRRIRAALLICVERKTGTIAGGGA